MSNHDAWIAKFATENPEASNRKIAKSVGVDEATVRRARKRLGLHHTRIPVDHVERFMFRVETPIHVDWDHCAITADWHIPLYNPELVNDFLDDCKERGIRHLVIGGDFLNGDALSNYFPKQEDAGLERELNEARAVMGVLARNFDEIVYINGNHDYRYVKSRNYTLGFVEVMKETFGDAGAEVLDKIRFTNLDHCYVGRERTFLVCHPKNYSRTPLSTARGLAGKYPWVDGIITAHSHHYAIGKAVDGARTVAEAGGFFDASKTAYLQGTTLFPHWTPGYLLLDNGNLVPGVPF